LAKDCNCCKRAARLAPHVCPTRAVAGDLPLDVLQRLMGHASIQTTGLYVRAERASSLAQLDAYFGHQAQGRTD